MKLSDAKDWLPLIQAAAEGKAIQANEGGEWHDIDKFVFGLCAYRVKPEPPLIKGAAYLCWDDGDEEKTLQLYVCDYDGEPRFSSYEGFEDAEWCTDWDNWELFVQPEGVDKP